MNSVTIRASGPKSNLVTRRIELLARMQLARQETAVTAQLVGADLRAALRVGVFIRAGWTLWNTAMLAGTAVWSLKTNANNAGKSRTTRLITFAISLVSAFRVIRNVRSYLSPPQPTTAKRELKP